MIVMGDYFKTNAMFQTNTTIDHDHVSVSGGEGTPSVTSGADVATNIADFVGAPDRFHEQVLPVHVDRARAGRRVAVLHRGLISRCPCDTCSPPRRRGPVVDQ